MKKLSKNQTQFSFTKKVQRQFYVLDDRFPLPVKIGITALLSTRFLKEELNKRKFVVTTVSFIGLAFLLTTQIKQQMLVINPSPIIEENVNITNNSNTGSWEQFNNSSYTTKVETVGNTVSVGWESYQINNTVNY